MSRNAQTHDRRNAPRKLQHAARGRHVPPPRRAHTRRTSGVQHGTWLTGDPSARGAKRETNTANRLALGRPIGESASY
jgi:hypothetical protein